MAIERLTQASILTLTKYSNMMAGSVLSFDYELLNTQVLASNAASVTFSGLAAYASTYKHLQIRYTARSTVAAASDNITVQFNADTGANYASHILLGPGSSTALSQAFTSANYMYVSSATTANSSTANNFGAGIIDILDFGATTKNKSLRYFAGLADSAYYRCALGSGFWNNTAALTQITLANSATFLTGTRFSIYGLKG